MKIIFDKVFLEHDTGMHPENRKRLEAFEGLRSRKVKSGEEFLGLIHSKRYIDKVRKACEKGSHIDQDTVVSKGSFEAAVRAVGATIKASEKGDFAMARPPGHHAFKDKPSGFCIFNNIAIAVKKLVDEGKRVLIFDFDGHLGDGTLDIFYETDKVMYMSIHQFPAFPNRGFVHEIGRGKGEGYTINIPLPPGSGDDILLDAINRFIPIAKQFNPDIVAVSAGFDGYQHDLLLDLRYSLNAFYRIGKILSDNFKDIFATLEGGYNIEALPKCAYNFIDGINRKRQRFKEPVTDSRLVAMDEYMGRIGLLEMKLSKYWKVDGR